MLFLLERVSLPSWSHFEPKNREFPFSQHPLVTRPPPSLDSQVPCGCVGLGIAWVRLALRGGWAVVGFSCFWGAGLDRKQGQCCPLEESQSQGRPRFSYQPPRRSFLAWCHCFFSCLVSNRGLLCLKGGWQPVGRRMKGVHSEGEAETRE